MKFKHYILKRQIEDVFIFPFILAGRLIAFLRPLKTEYETFFFFPFYHTGGAEKVHALISEATGNAKCIIYFTRKSYDTKFYKDFVTSGCAIRDISGYTDNKMLYFVNLLFRGIITGYINKQKLRPLVFNGQCNFGYKISPWVKQSIPQVELIHSFNTFSWIRIPFLPFISKTVMISKIRIEDHVRQYKKSFIPQEYELKIQHIVNGIPLPEQVWSKNYQDKLNVLYVGRGTEEKRVHLIARMAEEVAQQKLPVNFYFMGNVKGAIPLSALPYCKVLGHQGDETEIDRIYNTAHILVITSSTEGFPMVIEEAMARSCAIIATPVGDIPVHLKHNENGFIFSSVTDEATILKEGVGFIALLSDNRQLLKQFGEANYNYAYDHFGIQEFSEKYQQIFGTLRNN